LIVFFDTSVLIAATVAAHPKHSSCLPWLQKAKNKEIDAFISVHSLLETYSVLTTLPLSPRINPLLALTLIKENIISCFTLITYNAGDYKKILDDAAMSGINGGSVYDALIAAAAGRSKADIILTLNVNDFLRVSPLLVKLITQL